MKFLVFIQLFSFTLYAKDSVQSINLQEVSTQGLDRNVAKIFKQTKKLIIKARKSKDQETEMLASQKWCLLLHNYQFFIQAQACYRFVGMQEKSNAKWPF